MKPGFFIDRPVFSTVLSLVIVIVGIIGLVMLPGTSIHRSLHRLLKLAPRTQVQVP